MKVSELAKELNITSQQILETLKSLKLKAKDSNQELNIAVVPVLKSELMKRVRASADKAVDSSEPKTQEEVKDKEKPKTTKAQQTTKSKEDAIKTIAVSTIREKRSIKKKSLSDQDQAEKESKDAEAKKKTTGKKKIKTKELVKPKIKISKEPVITLKPLVRKRRKTAPISKEERKEKVLLAQEKTDEFAMSDSSTIDVKESTGESPRAAVPLETPKDIGVETEKLEVLPDIELKVPISVKDFSVRIQQKPSNVLMQLMKMGIFAHINQALGKDIVEKLTMQFGYRLVKVKTQEEQLIEAHKKEEDDPHLLKTRAPVITFMGHVDHGKTSLLDRIRKSKIADTEHGGITQHIGAYSVVLPKGRITFLDTPGHEAFTAMRARGAHITDIVVLVVAADEGIMPQTLEAIDHARAADVPIVVALNKIDRPNAEIDRVKKGLSEIGLTPEDWGGKTIVVGVSALTGEGVDHLLEMILLEAELLELKANAQKKASGIVVEAHLSRGKGTVTTLIVQSGTLKEGDVIVTGPFYGKIKAIFDDHQHLIKEAGPSMPVEILGLPEVPEAGELFYVVEDEKQAKEISFRRSEQLKSEKLQSAQKITLEDLYSQIEKGSIKELNVILKADVQGSLEALKDCLDKIPSDKIKLKFIHLGIGDVNISDVLLAVVSNAIIIAFHVEIGPKAKEELEKQPVDVRQYRIIYDAVNDIKKALEGLLEPKTKKKFVSRIEIREIFKLSKAGIIAGCYVLKGKVHRKVHVDVVRNNDIIYSGKISSLKRFKDDVRDVNEGMECGIAIDGFDQIQAGDIIEAYELESIAQKL